MQNYNIRGILLLSLVAAITATICDGYHVYTHTLSYPNPLLFNQAWWVFPSFFLAFSSMSINYLQLIHALPNTIATTESQTSGSLEHLIESLILFVMVYLLSAFGNNDPSMLSIIFYSTFIIRLFFSYERIFLTIIAIILAIAGMFFEGLLSHFELVAYHHVDIFYVPWWLGGLYMHGAFALRSGMRYFVYNK
ncbi:hypothetical protein [Acinetobacter sp. WCHAc060025]|uniref:hypothetical protein n=1 Tax=Acinetobacter sp. WCHAc060025 TaxID=2518625 RepID=UPI0010236052|nr:hypothetical protein [Acinetobacter sp. WCHAc060025]RZG75053.1 hypothetical protein EXE09_11510 [Acinetobacter sp. WCHAc060025]